jgi:Tol biopolymer transport system component
MELVDGQDLSRAIADGALPTAEVIDIAGQIASALESAHELGIVHRDLKPANVMRRGDGTIKILDFGLAKGTAGAEAGAGQGHPGSLADSPTLTAQGTQAGMILGTAAYMAPEQARGRAVDKRADIWAFGVVVYELLVGRRLFDADDVSDVLAAVLRQDVDFSALPADTPASVRALLERCLDRDLKTRLRDIGEARIALTRATVLPHGGGGGIGDRGSVAIGAAGAAGVTGATVTAPATTMASVPSSPRKGIVAALTGRMTLREVIAWILLAGAAVPGAVVAGVWLSNNPPNPGGASTDPSKGLAMLTFEPPGNVVADAGGAIISPDGEKIVFQGRAPDGTRCLWLRRLNSVHVTRLPSTDNAIEPFWAPNSESIAFGAQGKLKRLDLGATRAEVLTDAARLNNGAWSHTGTIVFSPDYRQPLMRVAATGGARTPATSLDQKAGDTGHRYPAFLPDGRHFLYAAHRDGGTAIVIGDTESDLRQELIPGVGGAVYARPGWLLYVQSGAVVARGFDADKLQLTSDQRPIADFTMQGSWAQGLRISASVTGTLLLQDAPDYDYSLMWYSRTASSVTMIGPSRKVSVAEFPRISADGTRVLVQRFDPATQNQDLWIGDLARNTFDRFTTNPALEQLGFWANDGKSVLASTARNGRNGIFRMPLAPGAEALIVNGTVFPAAQSPDGKTLYYVMRGPTSRTDIWAVPYAEAGLAAGAEVVGARAIVNSDADESQFDISPDGRWIAYTSDRSGTFEIYVRRLDADGLRAGEPTLVTTGGGTQPRWAHNRRELFYVNPSKGYRNAEMMVLPVTLSGPTFEFGPARMLFKASMLSLASVVRDYDVAPDDQRFLVGTTLGDGHPSPATILLNWTSVLKK